MKTKETKNLHKKKVDTCLKTAKVRMHKLFLQDLLLMLKKEHPEKTWLNCGLDVLCVMLFYDGDDLARIVEKVLRKFSFHLDKNVRLTF